RLSFVFTAPVSPAISPLSLHDALPIFLLSMMSLVRPSVRSIDMARPDAPHGNFATATSMFFSLACVSVSPHHAISGSVKMTAGRSEEHTSELQSLTNLVCRLLLEKKQS